MAETVWIALLIVVVILSSIAIGIAASEFDLGEKLGNKEPELSHEWVDYFDRSYKIGEAVRAYEVSPPSWFENDPWRFFVEYRSHYYGETWEYRHFEDTNVSVLIKQGGEGERRG